MSYSRGSLGLNLSRDIQRSTFNVLSPSQLAKIKAKAAQTKPAARAFDELRRALQAGTVRPSIPAGCGQNELPLLTLPQPGSRAFDRAPKYLQPDQLYISMMPLPPDAVLSEDQKSQVELYFRDRFDPSYAHYPVKVAKVCTSRGPAGHCYHHQGVGGKPHMEPDHAMEFGAKGGNDNAEKGVVPDAPYLPSSYTGKNANDLAHHWISIFSLLRDWWKLPYGWMNVAGREVFYWCPVPNRNSHYDYVDVNGTTLFGHGDRRIEAEPLSNYSTKVFMDALNFVGVSTVSWNDRWYMTPDGPLQEAVPPLIYIMDQWPSDTGTEWSKYVFDRGQLETGVDQWRRVVADAKSKGQPEPNLFKDAHSPKQQYYAHVQGGIVGLLSYAIDQNKSLRIWTLWKRYVQDNIVTPVQRAIEKSREKSDRLSAAASAGASAVAGASQAPDLAAQVQAAIDADPDPVNQMSIVDGVMAHVADLMRQIQAAPAAASELAPLPAQYIKESNFAGSVPLYYALSKAKTEGQGFERGKETIVYPHLVCEASREAVKVTNDGAPQFVEMSHQSSAALDAWSSVASQAPAAMQAYNDALQALDAIKATINLPWYLKKLGPMPVWGWMASGGGAFLGTAVIVRLRRKKKTPSVAKNRRRRTSR